MFLFLVGFASLASAQTRTATDAESSFRDLALNPEYTLQICTNASNQIILNIPFYNLGFDTVLSTTLNYLIDGVSSNSVNWQGALVPGDSSTIQITLNLNTSVSSSIFLDLFLDNSTGDLNSLNDSALAIVNIVDPVQITDALQDTTFCEGDVIAAVADQNFESYAWSTGSVQKGVVISTDGQYVVALTDSLGCVQNDTMIVSYHTVDENLLPTDSTYCGVNSVDLEIDASLSQIVWDDQSTSSVRTVNSSGVYSFSFKDVNSCDYYHEVSLTLADFPEVNLPDSIALCDGNEALIEALPGYAVYSWSTGDDESMVTINNPGIVTLEVTNVASCVTLDTTEVIYRDNPTPLIDEDTIICAGESTVLEPGDYSSYVWNTGEVSESITVEQPGIYAVEVEDELGCTGFAEVEMVEKSVDVDLGSDTTICEGSLLVLTPLGGFESYTWSDASNVSSLVVDQQGVYWVEVMAHQKCTARDTINVDVEELPVAMMQPVIQGAYVEFVNQSNTNNVVWDFGDGESSTEVDPLHIYSNLGVYTVTLEATNVCGTDTRSEQIEVSTLAVEDLLNTVELKLYPNPTTGSLTLRMVGYDEDANYQIYDGVGRLVGEGQIPFMDADRGVRIDVSSFARGFYELMILNGSDRRVIRFMKQ